MARGASAQRHNIVPLESPAALTRDELFTNATARSFGAALPTLRVETRLVRECDRRRTLALIGSNRRPGDSRPR